MSPRSLKRRDFAVTQAGYFTVLKPARSFSATLPPGSRYLNDPSKRPVPLPAPDQTAPVHAVGQEITIPLQIVSPSEGDHHLMRLLLIVLIAAALTLAVLWWMTPNNPFMHYGRNLF
ncbi:MAG: hypothetical protein ACLPLZ_05260 [Terracidiphilus sp.]